MTELLFDGEKAFKYIEKLAVDIGTRPSGSEAEKKAADWIASEFKALGLKTSIEEYLTRYVADAAAFPFERKIPEKQKKEIEDYFKRSMRGMP